jgi:hypothetical protein
LRQATHFEAGVVADEKIVAGIDERLATAARKLEEAVDGVIKKAE